ncbi:hypothetical protein HYQ45_006908 [Verticillium longisporum]|uniref:NADP-dependent oxidoreductase domain-containing protein n=1 Tax=Verticillium longisporum TaxID=100787 RepID=A0A8I2ZQC7_VERLO|nr:hypothetical protein HYQ45_006908 [Verticillium longisporum]
MKGPSIAASIPRLKLSSGHYIPQVGFGLWKVPAAQTADAVYGAIKAGYRHIDGAYGYANSAEAGQGVRRAIAHGLVSREDLFITSKLWNNHHAPAHATRMANEELRAWGLDHLDLYLIHFPIATQWVDPSVSRFPSWHADAAKTRLHPRARVPLADTWRALEALVDAPGVRAGPLRSIGVSNFDAQLLYDLLTYARVPPAVLQVEHHPYLAQPQLVAMARESGVAVTAYSTFGPQSFLELGNPRAAAAPPLMEVPLVKAIAASHGRTPGQVLLRWCTQRGIVVIPKSMRAERVRENLDCCGFDLEAGELEAISGLDRGLRFNDPGVTHGESVRIFT